MRTLGVFDQLSLDGYFTDDHGDMSWAHSHDPEWNQFVEHNASGGGALLFGRVTYDLMASFWPTPAAVAVMPVVARGMTAATKYVVSRTLASASWANTTVLRGDLVSEVRALKAQPGPNLTILGSGSLVAQLAQAGLIDTYQLVIKPVVLGAGRTLFEAVAQRPTLRLTSTRAFGNGSVLVGYAS